MTLIILVLGLSVSIFILFNIPHWKQAWENNRPASTFPVVIYQDFYPLEGKALLLLEHDEIYTVLVHLLGNPNNPAIVQALYIAEPEPYCYTSPGFYTMEQNSTMILYVVAFSKSTPKIRELR